MLWFICRFSLCKLANVLGHSPYNLCPDAVSFFKRPILGCGNYGVDAVCFYYTCNIVKCGSSVYQLAHSCNKEKEKNKQNVSKSTQQKRETTYIL